MKRLLWSGFAAVLVGTGLLLAACNGTVNPPIVVPSTALPIPTVPTKEQVLQRFGSNHPRLFVTAANFATVKNRIGSDTTLSGWYAAVQKEAQSILTQPVSSYVKPDGIRLLDTSRKVLKRIYTLAMIYHLSADTRYLERAWSELDAVAKFPDWNPSHFLDVGEMTHAFAIGYDWLYDAWTPQQRQELVTAIVEKGLKPGEAAYADPKVGWWTTVTHNWNLVCNGGLGLGALAIAEAQPELASRVISKALASIYDSKAIDEYAPDGASVEGPAYWGYGAQYLFSFLGGLKTSLGTDFGFSKVPGLAEAGNFPVHITGPTGSVFAFADSGDGRIDASILLWMAREYKRPEFAAYESQSPPVAHFLMWYDLLPKVPEPALDAYFRRAEVVTMRQAWNDPMATFAAFKAGSNAVNHSHLDIGSFALQALGQRWAIDLSGEDYNLPGYFNKTQRWTYYRTRAEGHNTLVINPNALPDQNISADTKVTKFNSQPQQAFGIADLSPAYPGSTVQRGLQLLENRHNVLVQDEIKTTKPATVWWFMHTKAEVAVDASGQSAMLSQGGKRLWARIVGLDGAKFTVMDAKPLASSPNPSGQNANAGIRKLAIQLTNVTDARITVLFVPLELGQNPPTQLPAVKPLAQW
jgi:Heparinase II/III-like protein/Domain of unknown function (DUF4962)